MRSPLSMFLALARNCTAFRASGRVFFQRRLRVDTQDRADRKEPGQAVREFLPDCIRFPLPYRLRELADFLDQPVEGFVEPALFILTQIYIGDEFLIGV